VYREKRLYTYCPHELRNRLQLAYYTPGYVTRSSRIFDSIRWFPLWCHN